MPINRAEQLEFKLKMISVAGAAPFEGYVLSQTTRKRIVLKPTDETGAYLHLLLIKTPKGANASFFPLAGPLAKEELWQKFL